MSKRIVRLPSEETVIKSSCDYVIEVANQAIVARGKFCIGLSGGSVSKYLSSGLPSCSTDWSKWFVFFCDERHVSYDDPDCTYAFYKENFFSKVPIPDQNIYPDNPKVSAEEAASEYETKLKRCFKDEQVPKFDLLVLGMGPDGHTCSLFPGHPLLQEKTKLIASIVDSPKPPPQRITMTYPLLNNARAVMFASCGAGKAQVLQNVLEHNITDDQSDELLPAARVKPSEGEVVWFLDEAAASRLSKK